MGKHLSDWENALKIQFPDRVRAEYPSDAWTYLFQCENCGYGSFWPAYEGSAEYYNAITQNGYYEENRVEFTRALHMIKQIGARTILEIGAGSGYFLKRVKENFPNIELHAVERNPSVHYHLSSLGAVHFDLNCLNNVFDVICAFQLIEHLADPFEFVRSCHERLGKKGIFMLSTPNYDGPIRYFCNSITETPPHHLTRWNPKSLRILLEKNGFADVKIFLFPLGKDMFHLYVQPMWWRMLRFLRLESRPQFVGFGNKIQRGLNRLKLQSLPLSRHNILVIGRKI